MSLDCGGGGGGVETFRTITVQRARHIE